MPWQRYHKKSITAGIHYLDSDVDNHIHWEGGVGWCGRGNQGGGGFLQLLHRIKLAHVLLLRSHSCWVDINTESWMPDAAQMFFHMTKNGVNKEQMVQKTDLRNSSPLEWWGWSPVLFPRSPADRGWWPFPLVESGGPPRRTVWLSLPPHCLYLWLRRKMGV